VNEQNELADLNKLPDRVFISVKKDLPPIKAKGSKQQEKEKKADSDAE
jgi:hypothetical protein